MKVNNIFVVEDDSFFAKGFIKRLSKFEGVGIHHFLTSEEALENMPFIKPEIIFLDHLLDGMNGVDAIPSFKEKQNECEIVIISNQRDLNILKEALDKGAAKYFSKDSLLLNNSSEFIEEIVNRETEYQGFWSNFFSYFEAKSSAFPSEK